MALLLFLVPSLCFANDWFVRPSAGSYGKGNGTSYCDAWSGFSKINWKQIRPGDNLYVCDTHIGKGMSIGASGADDRPITIRGDYPDHPGIILGASAVFTGSWELHDSTYNVWKRSFSAPSTYSDWHAFARRMTADPIDGIVRLNNVGNRETGGTGEKTDFASWKPGTYFYQKDGSTLYYKPIKGSANDHIYYAGYRPSCIASTNRHHFNITNLKVMMCGGSKYGGVIRLRNLHHVTVDRVSVRWGKYGIVFSPEWADRYKVSSDYVTVKNSTIRDCQAGIYPFGEVNHCLIMGNHIYDIGQYGYYLPWKRERWHGDIHGIALQGGGDDVRIEHNHVHHVGSEGIFPYGDDNPKGVNVQNLRNFSIRYNLVHDIKYLGGAVKPYYSSGRHSALYYNQNNDFPSEGLSNNVMAYNVIYNATHGVRMKCNANRNTGKAPWAVYNNVIYNTDVGIAWYSSGSAGGKQPHNKPGVIFKNNILLNVKSTFVSIAMPTIKEYDQVIFDNNIYYPDLPNGFQWPGNKGHFVAWKGWDSGIRRERHSMVADPKFRDVTDHDFHLLQGSPAIDAGENVGLTKDYDGKSVPTGKAPDIGTYEFELTDEN